MQKIEEENQDRITRSHKTCDQFDWKDWKNMFDVCYESAMKFSKYLSDEEVEMWAWKFFETFVNPIQDKRPTIEISDVTNELREYLNIDE